MWLKMAVNGTVSGGNGGGGGVGNAGAGDVGTGGASRGGADHENQNDGVGGSDVGVTVALKPIFERQSIHGHPISALS